jgi:hypothetical protein
MHTSHVEREPSDDRDQITELPGPWIVFPFLFLGACVIGCGVAGYRWAAHTPLLGARLPSAAHASIVIVFAAACVVLLAAIVWYLLGRVARRD